jgi:hypothetical protein
MLKYFLLCKRKTSMARLLHSSPPTIFRAAPLVSIAFLASATAPFAQVATLTLNANGELFSAEQSATPAVNCSTAGATNRYGTNGVMSADDGTVISGATIFINREPAPAAKAFQEWVEAKFSRRHVV